MKLILAQPAVPRFQWELEVLLTNIRQFTQDEVILLFTKHDDTVPRYLTNKYEGVRCFVYADQRDWSGYIPSVRPWLLSKYFAQDPSRVNDTYFYIDSDIIFRQWPDFATLGIDGNKVIGSDCGGYIDLDYILGVEKGAEIAQNMANICGITVDQMRGVPGIGAQLVFTNLGADFWQRSYQDSNRIYRYLELVDSNIQKWTAEMWAQLWGWVREGKQILMPKELDFCRPTDLLAEWDKVKIMHNAGVTGAEGDMFFKGQYVDRMPFGEDFSFVDPRKVSIKYVEALNNVMIKRA